MTSAGVDSNAANEQGTWFARVIAVLAAFDVLAMTQVPWGLPAPRVLTGSDPFFVLARAPWLLFALSCAAWVALAAFARAPERTRFGFFALVPMFVLQETLGRVQGVHEEPFFQPAGALFGWVLAITLARALAHHDGRTLEPGDERRAGLAGATAVIGATYFNAGVSKLLAEGLAWAANPVHVRAMTLAHQPVPPTAFDDIVIGALGRSATLGRAAATFTLVAELGGAVFALSSRFRRGAALGLVLWHAGLLFMTGICFYGGLVLVVCLGDRQWPERIERVIVWTGLRDRSGRIPTRAILLAGLLAASILALPVIAMTRVTSRGMASSVVALAFCLAAAVGFPWRELVTRVHGESSTARPAAPRQLHVGATSLVCLGVAAIIAGLYLLPFARHDHHYQNVPTYQR